MSNPLSGLVDHPDLGRASYQLKAVSDDPDQQVCDVIGLMQEYAIEDSRNPVLIEDVARAWQSDNPIADTWAYLRRDGLRGMRFVRDELTALPFRAFEYPAAGGWRPIVEAITRPEFLAQCSAPQGDCDCFATYGAAHLLARGIKCSFATVAADSIDPSMYSHVYLVAYPAPGIRIPLDLSHGPEPGWEVPNMYGKLCEWPLSGSWLTWALIAAGALLLYRRLN